MPDNNNISPNTDFENMLADSNFHFPGKPTLTAFATMGTEPNVHIDPKAAVANLQDQVNAVPDYGVRPESGGSFSPLQVDTSGRFPYQRLGADNEDLYGQGQSVLKQGFNGVVKGLNLAGTTFLQGTLGTVYGLDQVLTGNGLHSFYDNDFSQAIQKWNDGAENVLPNYQTAKQRDAAWYQPNNWFTANFLWDKLVKNVGFSIGAIYSGGAVAKGLGLLKGLIPAFDVAKAAEVANTLETELSAVPPLQRWNFAQNIIRGASDKFNATAGGLLNNGTTERFLVSTVGAAAEGGMEAIQGVNDFRNQRIREYTDKYGVAPIGADMDKIDDAASSLGNARFTLNMALLTATNYIQLPKILGSTYKDSKAIANTAAGEIGAVRRNAEGMLERALPTTKIGRRLSEVSNVAGLLFSPSEAFEEVAQYAIQKGVEHYYNKAYAGQGRDFLQSLGEGWGDAFRDKEGMESLLLGGISGGLQQIRGEVKERGVTGTGGERGAATERFTSQANANPLNLNSGKWTQEMASAAARGVTLMHEQEAHIRQGDVLEVKDNEADQLHNYLAPRIKYGRYDLVKDDIASFKSIGASEQGLQSLKDKGYAAPSDTVRTFADRLANFEKHADNINSLYNSLNIRYGGKNSRHSESTIDKMVYAASKIADYDDRLPSVARNLTQHGVDVSSVISTDLFGASVSKDSVRDALKVINDLKQDGSGRTVTSDTRDELKSNLRDIIEMSLRRKEFLKEYESIKANPEQHYSANIGDRVEKVVLKQKSPISSRATVDEEFNVGQEYSLKTPITREGNSIILAPKLTPVSGTLEKEVEAVLPGQTQPTFIPQKAFRQYELSTFNNQSKDVEDAFKKAVPEIISKAQFRPLQQSFKGVDKEDANAIQDFVNEQNSPELADEIVKALRPVLNSIKKKADAERKAAEDLVKTEAARKELDKIQKENDNKAGFFGPDGPDVNLEEEDEDNGYKKAPIGNFLSKEADFYDPKNPKPHQQRRLSFLTNIASIQGTQEAARLKVLAITKSNEQEYGLKGLRDWVVNDLKNTALSSEIYDKYFNPDGTIKPEQEPIIKVYVVKDAKGKLFISDVNGEKLSELSGDALDSLTSKGVFGLFHSDLQGIYTFGPKIGKNNYVGSENDFERAKGQFQNWRKAILEKTDSAQYDISGVSRGVVQRDDENKPVTSTVLAKEVDLSKEGIIFIPSVVGAVTINNISYNFPLGVPVLKNGSNVEFLNNRKFSPEEGVTIFNALKQWAQYKAAPEGQRAANWVRSVLYLRAPAIGAPVLAHQSYLDGAGLFHFGPNVAFPFTEQSFEANKDAILSHFTDTFVKINNKYLTQDPYEEAYTNAQGQLAFRSHPTYSEYLLSDKLGTPYLQTKIRRQIDENDPVIVSRYSTLGGNEFEFTAEVQPKSVPKPVATDVGEEPIGEGGGEITREESAFTGKVEFGKGRVAPKTEEKPKTGGLFKNRGALTPEEKARLDKLAEERKKNQRDLGEFKMANEVEQYQPINLQKELDYIKARSPFSVSILDNIIRTPEGLYAWGKYKSMVISLYNQAQSGTGYHELFEGVWKEFLSPDEQYKMFREFRSRKGNFSFFDGTEYSFIPHAEATEFHVKESLADEFARYVANKELPRESAIARWFKSLWDFIKSIFSGEVKVIDKIFANIDAAKYKSIPSTPLSISESEQYSLADVSYVQQYQTIRGVALQVIQEMLNPNNPEGVSLTEFEETTVDVKEFYDRTYNKLAYIYEGLTEDEVPNEKQRESLNQYWENIKTDWPVITKLTSEYLNTYSIVESLKEAENRTKAGDYSNRDYIDDSKYFLNDAKNTASRSIKLLIATLPETVFNTTGGITSRRNESFMQEQVNYAKTFNGVLYKIAELNTLSEKMNRLNELSASDANFKRLYERLTKPSNTNNSQSVMNDWKLKVRFFQVMSKQVPKAYIQFNQSDKTSRTGTRNLDSSIKQITQGWIDNLKNLAFSGKSDVAGVTEDGDLVVVTRNLTNNVRTPENKINFLNQLQIPFTISMFNRLSPQEQQQFNDAVVGLHSQLNKRLFYPLEDTKAWRSVGNMENLAISFINAGNDFESTFFNMEGEMQAKFVATNKISRDINDINNAINRNELFEKMPWLEQIKDSMYLNNLLFSQDGRRNKTPLQIAYIQGTIDSNGRPVTGDNLSVNQRLTQEINQNLNERYYALIPADSKTQWMVEMVNPITFKNIATDSHDWRTRFVEKMTEYYNTEKNSYLNMKDVLSETDLAKRAGVFKIISKNYVMPDVDFHFAMNNFLELQAGEQRRFFEKYLTIQPNKLDGSYSWEGLDKTFLTANNLNHKRLSSTDIDNILKFRTVNYIINNIELQKIFFGDILHYSDEKRYKLFLSPRESSIHDEPDFNNHLNTEFNRVGNIPLSNNLLGKHMFSDVIRTVTMQDVISVNEELAKLDKAYENTNATDASAISTIVGGRERRIKGGNWTVKDEQQFQYEMARDRLLMYEDGYLTNLIYPSNLKGHDEKVVAKGNPNISYVYVEKPIVSGHTQIDGVYSPIVDKFSIVSYSYAALRNNNLRDHYVKMLKQDVGYLIVQSGRKIVGSEDADAFYDGEGNVNKDPYSAIINVPFSTFGVQSDTSSKKEQQTRGTQVTKLVILNLYNAGKPVSEKADSLAKQNIALLREQVEIGYQKLLKQIGAEDVDGKYRITNKSKVLQLIKNELLRRDVADAIKQQLQLDGYGELKTAFEAMPNYIQIKQILYAHIDKAITSPKVNGAPQVQVSGALMETYGLKRQIVNGKAVVTSSSLKFYTKDEPWMEVLMPAQMGKQLRNAGLKWNTEEELMELLKKSPDFQRVISGVGFRIPTQELNSIENFRIKGFLPEEMGNTIVVPEEITTKAGSDFDIDKLNTYLQNIYVDSKGVPRIVPYFGIGEDAKAKLRKLITEDEWSKMFKLSAKDKIEAFYEEQNEINIEEGERDIDAIYRQSIENEYFKSMQDILSLPENFERLVTPNSSDNLKGIRDSLVNLAPYEFSEGLDRTIISPMYLLNTRHNAISGKKLVGISALAQTGTAVAQLSPITLNYAKVRTMPWRDRNLIGPNATILLPHNTIDGMPILSNIKDREGRYISDKVSQYINGTVDIFKDAFLPQINFNNKTAGVYLMLERLGVPNSTSHPIVSYFMNQPIIREFVKYSDVRRARNLLNSELIAKFNTSVRSVKFRVAAGVKIPSELPTGTEALTALLKGNIEKYYEGIDLSKEEMATQSLIFKEFVKYLVYSQQLFQLQQATNYDTANLNDSYALAFKERDTAKALQFNVFSSPEAYLDSTFIGAQRNALGNATETLSDVLKINNPLTQKHLQPVLDVIAGKFIPQDDKLYMARRMEESLINHLTQTQTGMNASLKAMMVDKETAIVNQLREIKSKVKTDDNFNSLSGNIILQQLTPYIRGKNVFATKNITLAVKARDVFTKNLYNSSFQQLLDNPITQKLAHDLVILSFLQNGVANSVISYRDAIPAEVYSSVMKDVVPHLLDTDAIDRFVSTGAFFRNNAADSTIVPVVFNDDYQLYAPHAAVQELNKKVNGDTTPPLTLWYPAWKNDPFVLHINTIDNADSEEDAIVLKTLFRRVENEIGIGVVESIQKNSDVDVAEGADPTETEKRALYIQVNAWGDGFRAQEYYDEPRQSVFANGYQKVERELDPVQVANYIENLQWKAGEEEESVRHIPFEEFRESMFDSIMTVKDSSLDWRITIPDLTQAEREKAVEDVRKGKTTKRADRLNEALKMMYEDGVVTMNRGRGNHAETRDFPISEILGGESSGKLFQKDPFEHFKDGLNTKDC